MPGESGRDILAELKLLRRELLTLILSTLPKDQFGTTSRLRKKSYTG
jgi:hypothetical protein